MQHRRQWANPMFAVLLAVAMVASAAFGGQHILQVQNVAPAATGVYADEASFDTGANITVDDAAVRTQSGEEDTVRRVVKEFTREREFSVVALTWKGPRDIVAYVRSQRADGSWSPWFEMDPDDSPTGVETSGTEPIFVERTKRIQVSTGNVDLLEDGRAASEAPTTARDIQAVFLDGGVDENVITPAADSYSRAMPKVITRAQWGATSRNTPYYSEPVKAVTVHHTAGSNNYSRAESAGIVRSIEHYHAHVRGWGDIGYNALVDKYGNIYEGRAGGLDRAVQGAHVGGFNTNTWGVSMMGDYSKTAPTTASLQAMGELIGWKAAVAGFDPMGTSYLSADFSFAGARYGAGKGAYFPNVNAHRDFHFSDCPGDGLYNRLPDIRRVAKVKYTATKASRSFVSPAIPNRDGTNTTVTSPSNGTGTKVANTLTKLADGDTATIATVVGTIAGVALIYALQNGQLGDQVKNVGGTEIISGITVQDVTPMIGPALEVVGSSEASTVWKSFEPIMGKLAGTVSGVGGQQMALYANGLAVKDTDGEIYALVGQIANAWLQQGLDAGPLGMPITPQRNANHDEIRMDFQGGAIVYSISQRNINIITN